MNKVIFLVVKKLAALLENLGMGLLVGAFTFFVTGDTVNAGLAAILGVMFYVTGFVVDIVNELVGE